MGWRGSQRAPVAPKHSAAGRQDIVQATTAR